MVSKCPKCQSAIYGDDHECRPDYRDLAARFQSGRTGTNHPGIFVTPVDADAIQRALDMLAGATEAWALVLAVASEFDALGELYPVRAEAEQAKKNKGMGAFKFAVRGVLILPATTAEGGDAGK
jgi:hypothetical protein